MPAHTVKRSILAQSATNKERLGTAVKDIQFGKYEAHGLLNLFII